MGGGHSSTIQTGGVIDKTAVFLHIVGILSNRTADDHSCSCRPVIYRSFRKVTEWLLRISKQAS